MDIATETTFETKKTQGKSQIWKKTHTGWIPTPNDGATMHMMTFAWKCFVFDWWDVQFWMKVQKDNATWINNRKKGKEPATCQIFLDPNIKTYDWLTTITLLSYYSKSSNQPNCVFFPLARPRAAAAVARYIVSQISHDQNFLNGWNMTMTIHSPTTRRTTYLHTYIPTFLHSYIPYDDYTYNDHNDHDDKYYRSPPLCTSRKGRGKGGENFRSFIFQFLF